MLTSENLVSELQKIVGSEITNELKEEIEFNKEFKATYTRSNKLYKGYYVFIPEYEKDPIIGYPYVILAKKGDARLSTDEESIELLDLTE